MDKIKQMIKNIFFKKEKIVKTNNLYDFINDSFKYSTYVPINNNLLVEIEQEIRCLNITIKNIFNIEYEVIVSYEIKNNELELQLNPQITKLIKF